MIFNLFKSKPTLRELIPKAFVDIHSHILPGIDDGAKNVEESIFLIKKMKEFGFSKIIGTPHTYPGLYENNIKTINNAFRELKDKIPKGIEVSYASEYMADISILDKIKNKEILTIKNKYILIETGFNSKPTNLRDLIFEIRLNDLTPIIAHPERYLYVNENFRIIEGLKKMGCKFQINLLSTTGYYGKNISKLSDKLLKREYIDYVGTDIHNERHISSFNNKVVISEVELLKKAIRNNQVFY